MSKLSPEEMNVFLALASRLGAGPIAAEAASLRAPTPAISPAPTTESLPRSSSPFEILSMTENPSFLPRPSPAADRIPSRPPEDRFQRFMNYRTPSTTSVASTNLFSKAASISRGSSRPGNSKGTSRIGKPVKFGKTGEIHWIPTRFFSAHSVRLDGDKLEALLRTCGEANYSISPGLREGDSGSTVSEKVVKGFAMKKIFIHTTMFGYSHQLSLQGEHSDLDAEQGTATFRNSNYVFAVTTSNQSDHEFVNKYKQNLVAVQAEKEEAESEIVEEEKRKGKRKEAEAEEEEEPHGGTPVKRGERDGHCPSCSLWISGSLMVAHREGCSGKKLSDTIWKELNPPMCDPLTPRPPRPKKQRKGRRGAVTRSISANREADSSSITDKPVSVTDNSTIDYEAFDEGSYRNMLEDFDPVALDVEDVQSTAQFASLLGVEVLDTTTGSLDDSLDDRSSDNDTDFHSVDSDKEAEQAAMTSKLHPSEQSPTPRPVEKQQTRKRLPTVTPKSHGRRRQKSTTPVADKMVSVPGPLSSRGRVTRPQLFK